MSSETIDKKSTQCLWYIHGVEEMARRRGSGITSLGFNQDQGLCHFLVRQPFLCSQVYIVLFMMLMRLVAPSRAHCYVRRCFSVYLRHVLIGSNHHNVCYHATLLGRVLLCTRVVYIFRAPTRGFHSSHTIV